ncbi:FG-GAP repeat domain-containing protein, partial [Streptomyces sp. NPDC056387]|uniref:FG-GAP repeat domain-containing protein n=1 Tax=Streptomyces sp. NPDC056387 TaxID=3345803 RepID=UPI0035E1B0AC
MTDRARSAGRAQRPTVAAAVLAVAMCLTGPARADGPPGHPAYRNHAVGNRPLAVAVADLDGDGRLDLVTSDFADSTVSVLLNRGGGDFGPRVAYATGVNPTSVTTADLNGDARADIVTSDGAGTVSVLTNHGDGTFGPAAIHPTGTNPSAVTTADLDGDGRLDLVTSDFADST